MNQIGGLNLGNQLLNMMLNQKGKSKAISPLTSLQGKSASASVQLTLDTVQISASLTMKMTQAQVSATGVKASISGGHVEFPRYPDPYNQFFKSTPERLPTYRAGTRSPHDYMSKSEPEMSEEEYKQAIIALAKKTAATSNDP